MATQQTYLYYGSVNIDSIETNIDISMFADGFYYLSSSSTETRGFLVVWYESEDNTLFYITLFSRENVQATFTLQYTKTTD